MKYDIDAMRAHFGNREFGGKDLAAYLGLSNYHETGSIIKQLRNKGHIRITASHTWCFQTPSSVTELAPTPLISTSQSPVRKIGGYYFHERAIMIADVVQDGKVVIFTNILEIDGETKHPRNKRVIFTQQHAPAEYRATIAWLDELAGQPPTAMNDAERDAALQLADEATQKLIIAQKENADLRAKLDGIKAAMNGALL